jgi:hypothetical protein
VRGLQVIGGMSLMETVSISLMGVYPPKGLKGPQFLPLFHSFLLPSYEMSDLVLPHTPVVMGCLTMGLSNRTN